MKKIGVLLLCGVVGICSIAVGAPRAPVDRSFVVLTGRVTEEISAHVSSYPRGKGVEQEFRRDNGDHVVVYAKARIACSARVQLTGKWFEFAVEPQQRRGETITKTREKYTERHFKVDRWKCM